MDDSTLGSRIHAARLVAGLTQVELARRSKVSVSLIRQLEQGERATARNETLHKLAGPLGTTTSRLSAGPDAEPANAVDIAGWEGVRQAALGNHVDQAGEEPTLAGTRAALRALVPLALQSRHDELRGLLPAMLRDCDALVSLTSDPKARHVRATARQLAAYMLGQTWQLPAAGDVLRLALDDAAGDLRVEQAAAAWLTWVLLRSGDLHAAAGLASDWADRGEPRMARSSLGELAGWGRFQIYLATVAARDGRAGEAEASLRWARAAAAAAGHDYIPEGNPWDVFGPVTVEMVAAEIAVVRGRLGDTVRIADQVDTRGVPVPRNVLRHKLDVARALATAPSSSGIRDHGKAVRVLLEVQGAAPEWLAQQRGAAETVSVLMGKRRKLSDEVAGLARTVRLVS